MVDTYKSLFLGIVERSVFPFIIAFYINGLCRRDLKYSLGLALLSFPALGRFPVMSARYGLAILGAFLVISFAWILSSKASKRIGAFWFSTKFLLVTALLALAVNLYWVVPYLELRAIFASTLASFHLNYSYNYWSTLTNSIRLL